MTVRMSLAKKLSLFTALFCLSSIAFAGELYVRLERDEGYLGQYLTGMHFVYNNEKDNIYSDDTVAKWARQAGVAVARYPGGTVIKSWDWKNPSGYQTVDLWDDPSAKKAAPSEWMSIDEYLHFVDVSGITPLIGINLLSGFRHNRVAESIKRAAEQVEYVVAKGHRGAFYYLGNEDMGQMGKIEDAAAIFVAHAKAIKQVDPAARLFWNDNAVNKVRLKKFLKVAGAYADGVEFHGKWPYGDSKIRKKVTVSDWQNQYPIRGEKRGSYSERALELRAYAAQLGYPKLMIANNEYGLSQFKKDPFIGFNRFDYGLVIIEYLQDLYIGRFDMAAFWSTVAENTTGGKDREMKRLIDTKVDNRLNPVHFGFELLSSAQGKRYVAVENGGVAGYGFAALTEDTLEIFLLNKTNTSNEVKFKFRDGEVGAEGTIISLIDTPDHWGKLHTRPAQIKGSTVTVTLPPMSYSKIILPSDYGNKH